MDPAVDGDVIDLDASFGEEFFDISVGESVSEVATNSEHDDLRLESVAAER